MFLANQVQILDKNAGISLYTLYNFYLNSKNIKIIFRI